jgi:hypothetical protein
MTDWTPSRAEGEKRLAAFTPRMGRRYANGRNTEPGPGAQKALSPCGRRRLVPESEVAEDMLRLLPRGTHDPAMYITPAELRAAMLGAGLVPGAITDVDPRGINGRFDLTFGPLPLTAMLYMVVARKPAAVEAAA